MAAQVLDTRCDIDQHRASSLHRIELRWLDAGPSRFYELFFTDMNNLNQRIRFHQISTDGNLLERPVEVESVRISVAERADVIIDFSQYAGKVVGHTLAMEGLFAFFLESSFLSLLVWGERRLSARGHFMAAVALFVGSWLSGYFIVATNALT